MIVLRLAAGGRIAVNPEDVVAAQPSVWGTVINLASTGDGFEVEHTVEDLRKRLKGLNLMAGETAINPNLLASIYEINSVLHFKMKGGLEMRQTGVDIDHFLDAIAQVDAHAAGDGAEATSRGNAKA
ncbi:hypothetical protein P7B02_15225 [Caulobacter segnis]|uniref:hypothetical protein n=1 Tax=Caulobacter segnis TaxID=88688 RepID=UPI00241015DC|nr:hypothetical protein [Caulobacter segnis]MDG2522887.1 hypothetical protein [Caulobacter segnis]